MDWVNILYILIVFTYFRFLKSLWIVCILYFLKFYEILFENHILYEEVISIKITIYLFKSAADLKSDNRLSSKFRQPRERRIFIYKSLSQQHQSNVFNHWYVYFFHGGIELQRVRSDKNSLLWFSFRLLLKSRPYCSVEDYSPSQSPTKTSYICPSGTGVFLYLVLLNFTPDASNSFSFPSLRSSCTATLSSTVTVTVYTRKTATNYLVIHVPEILQKSCYSYYYYCYCRRCCCPSGWSQYFHFLLHTMML